METIRYFITTVNPDLSSAEDLTEYHYLKLGNSFLYRVHLNMASLKIIESLFGVKALPGLNAPSTALSPAILSQINVTPLSGEVVLNTLRRWRNMNGETDTFDIS